MRRTCLLLGVLLLAAAFGLTQSGGASHHRPEPVNTDPQFGQHRNQAEAAERQMERDQTRRLNKERQASLQRDTDKLLALATQLKQYVDKTNENILSVEVLKKADEIEKLAHNVREKMKNSP